MKNFFETNEMPPKVIAASPAVESLLNAGSGQEDESVWPESVLNNPELRIQAEKRRDLSASISSLFSAMPKATMTVAEALDGNLVSEASVEQTYRSLSNFLEEDETNARMALYLPFELIPDSKFYPKSQNLDREVNRFRDLYMKKWRELLSQQDLRANFADGDIPELELRSGPLPKVCKAGHMIPILMQKGLISFEEVAGMIEKSSDQILRDSIADAIPVLCDMNLLSEDQIEAMSKSSDPLLRNMSVIVRDNLKHAAKYGHKHDDASDSESPVEHDEEALSGMMTTMHEEFDAMEKSALHDTDKLPKKRVEWIKKNKQQKLIDDYSAELSSILIARSAESEQVRKGVVDSLGLSLNHLKEDNHESAHGLPDMIMEIEAVRKAVEKASSSDIGNAKEIADQFKSVFEEIWKNGPLEAQKSLEKAWSRWSVLGIVDESYTHQLVIKTPAFEESFAIANEGLNVEMEKLTSIVKHIESDPELSKKLYPALILFGSKVKGYGTLGADIDVATFIRPDVRTEERRYIQEQLNALFAGQQMDGGAVEFWLENVNFDNAGGDNAESKTAQGGDGSEMLMVRDFSNPDKTLGGSSYVHVLMEGAWCGESDSVKELHQKLLTNYFHLGGDKKTRGAFLREMERDTLQYRLMHRGYSQFYPDQGGMKTQHSNGIDPESAFWDSGYRRVATKLFLEKVFLPKL